MDGDGIEFKSPGLLNCAPGQFLNTAILSPSVQDELGSNLVHKHAENTPHNSAQFFEELKWLVFKVKQRAAQDYEAYRASQKRTALSQKGYQRKQQEDLQYSPLNCLSTTEIYGANWPYDFLSLLERVKIEIEYMVEG